MEGTIPDGLAGEIIRNTITPHFREGRFAEGIEAGVAQIVETIVRHKQIQIPAPESPRLQTTAPEQDTRRWRLSSLATPVLLFLLLLIGLIAISMASKRSFRTTAARADSATASSGFQSVPTAAARQVAASAADRAEAAAPAEVGDRNSASTLDCGYKL